MKKCERCYNPLFSAGRILVKGNVVRTVKVYYCKVCGHRCI